MQSTPSIRHRVLARLDPTKVCLSRDEGARDGVVLDCAPAGAAFVDRPDETPRLRLRMTDEEGGVFVCERMIPMHHPAFAALDRAWICAIRGDAAGVIAAFRGLA